MRFVAAASGWPERQTRKSGVRPAARRDWTECCVGFVFSSPTTPITGTSETWKKHLCTVRLWIVRL